MDERFQYAEVRQRLIDALKTDLMGPQNVDEVLDENPMFAYIIGMLYPQTNTSADGVDVGEQEVEADIAYEDGEDYTSGEEDDNEPVAATKFKQQSSIGLSFYVEATTPSINLDITWGDYVICVDQSKTLITSANLSYHGQEGNIEMGTYIESATIARQVDEVFTKLLFSKVFLEYM